MPGTVVAPLGAVLEAAGHEAGRLAGLGLELQESLSALLRASPAGSELQALDALVQQAQGLRGFLSALAGACSGTWGVDAGEAAAGLLLGAQRKRLALDPCTDSACAPTGVCELF